MSTQISLTNRHSSCIEFSPLYDHDRNIKRDHPCQFLYLLIHPLLEFSTAVPAPNLSPATGSEFRVHSPLTHRTHHLIDTLSQCTEASTTATKKVKCLHNSPCRLALIPKRRVGSISDKFNRRILGTAYLNRQMMT